jgi:drug/metabolite transporter (DMT)-like permease
VRDVIGQVGDAPVQSNLLVLYLAIPGGALGYFLISFALSRLSPTQTALYINLNPIFAIVLATLLLDESITGWFVAGLIIVIAGLILANMRAVRTRQPVIQA